VVLAVSTYPLPYLNPFPLSFRSIRHWNPRSLCLVHCFVPAVTSSKSPISLGSGYLYCDSLQLSVCLRGTATVLFSGQLRLRRHFCPPCPLSRGTSLLFCPIGASVAPNKPSVWLGRAQLPSTYSVCPAH
jgi:hypothetical protein